MYHTNVVLLICQLWVRHVCYYVVHIWINSWKNILLRERKGIQCLSAIQVFTSEFFTDSILGNIFYTPEYRDTFLSLIRKFNMTIQTKWGEYFCFCCCFYCYFYCYCCWKLFHFKSKYYVFRYDLFLLRIILVMLMVVIIWCMLFFRSYLRDLIEAFHIFLKMLEKYCSGKTHIVVKVTS